MNSELHSIVNQLEYYIYLKLVQVKASNVLIKIMLRLILFVFVLMFKIIKHVFLPPAATSKSLGSPMQNDAVERNLNETGHSSNLAHETTTFELVSNATPYSSPICIETRDDSYELPPSSISPVYSAVGTTISFESDKEEDAFTSSESASNSSIEAGDNNKQQVEFDLGSENLDALIRKLIFKYYEANSKSYNPNLVDQVSYP